MRATLMVLLLFSLLAGAGRARAQLALGSPESAFAGGPIQLTKTQTARLAAHYQGDKVPLVPQPFRGRLDTALVGKDWQRARAETHALEASYGIVPVLAWEQSRFLATGSLGVAELHALDAATSGSAQLEETAVMLWFYAAAVTLTDGHKCLDPAAKDAHLDRLRGPAFAPVTKLVRAMPEDRLAAMRDLAIKLEAVLAPDRTDDLMCRVGDGPADVRPDQAWRPDAALTRAMLPRHLVALASIMRPRQDTRPEPVKPEPFRPEAAAPRPTPAVAEPPKIPPAPIPPVGIAPINGEPVRIDPPWTEPAQSAAETSAPPKAAPSAPVRTELAAPGLASPKPEPRPPAPPPPTPPTPAPPTPAPSAPEPPRPRLTTPDSQPN